ncbi:MAG TPA: TIGR02996 domain-containing protein [Gemmataceae bacterium]|nr:TIGR02996 domain-containing protein [Gemmataceae bacterium]
METEDSALWRAVVAAPHDDAPRLIYADWLEEHGEPERAEFVRVQCRLARLDDDAPDRPALERRERHLWQKYKCAWRAGLPARMRECPFRRGFVHPKAVSLTPKQFLQLGDDDLARAPLWDVRLKLRGPGSLAGLADTDRLRRLAGLELDCAGLEPAHLSRFLATPGLCNVRALALWGGPYTLDHVRAVSNSPLSTRLTHLAVRSAPGLGPEGAEALAAADGLRRLEVLELVNCGLRDAGLRMLLNSPHLAALKELRVPYNWLTASAVRALFECRHLKGLRVLDLGYNRLDDDGARVLALWPAGDRLTQLDLGWNRIHRPGAESLAQSPFLAGVRDLSLLGNPCANDQATVTGLRFRFSDRVRLTSR